MKCIPALLLLLLTALPANGLWSQAKEPQEIAALVRALKSDIRGPYRDIRWFCTDGSIRMPRDPCPDDIGPGVQHARYKDEVRALAASNHIHFGQILADSDFGAFWDAEHGHARLKQYQLESYLKSVDDGWILRRGQYYRGAVQSEDEAAWGVQFYQWLLGNDRELAHNFFLIRQSLKDIPHRGDDNLAQAMRSQSKILSDAYPDFMDLRIKIHGQPEATDIPKVEQFARQRSGNLSPALQRQFTELISTMKAFHAPVSLDEFNGYTDRLKDGPARAALSQFAANQGLAQYPRELALEASGLLLLLRQELEAAAPEERLELLDASLKLEELVFKVTPDWATPDLKSLMEKICYLGMASAGAGYIELWEWEQLASDLSGYESNSMTLGQLNHFLERARGEVEWSAAMVKANYEEVVSTYAAFEPLAAGFTDDRIRGSVALHLGDAVGALGAYVAEESKLTNRVMDLRNQSAVRGLNPGYALGELVVVSGAAEMPEVSPNKIYVFQRPPSDLKPVAGIATVSEGNLVSHVQLLARNLGIPNAALSDENLNELKKYHGQRVFYAVSARGNAIMKPESAMTAEEKGLFTTQARREERIEIPVGQIRLDESRVLNMRDVDAEDSGKLCGPKAANLGQLKKMFPDLVVEGLVIPFGIFRDHMDQRMPDRSESYWVYLNDTFKEAERMRNRGVADTEVESYQLGRLQTLREAIRSMPLRPAFVGDLQSGFKEVLGGELGQVPVFLRSDTNMEDLKEFTGAGLNLTLFNVVPEESILEGIRAVWASPYTERSFKWRQKYLLNPENVYPSILVIPSVDVDYSGVLITKGIVSDNDRDLTVAFSRGAGGAVDGQAAESWLLREDGRATLLAPAREADYNRLPAAGGTQKETATFETRILKPANLSRIRQLAGTITKRLPEETGHSNEGAWDVELGFTNDKLWLFQIRPFVENKKALSSGYLESISPKLDSNRKINLKTAR